MTRNGKIIVVAAWAGAVLGAIGVVADGWWIITLLTMATLAGIVTMSQLTIATLERHIERLTRDHYDQVRYP